MTTATDITIQQGATFSQSLTVTDTTGKTYAAQVLDRFWNAWATLTCTIVDGTTVTVSLTATQTGDMAAPVNIGVRERSINAGHWQLEESDGGTVTRTHEGNVVFSRKKSGGV